MTSHCSHGRTGNIASILMSWKHYAFIVDCETKTHFISIMFATFTSSFKYCGLPLSNFSPIFQDIFLISQRNQWKMQKARDNCRFFVPPRTSWDDEQCGRMVDGDRIESWQTAPRVPASQLQRPGAADIPRSRTQYICQKKYLRSKSGRIFLDCIMWQKPDIKPLKLVTFVSNLFQIHSLALSTSQPI